MKNILLGIIAIGVIALVGVNLKGEEINLNTGSVGITGEYHATTTAVSATYGTTITGDGQIKIGQGTLGSVVITGADTGILNFYNATTSNVDLRTKNTASSTILMASIPASTAAGTYTFDVVFSDGLLLDVVSGNIPTTTITWR
jgi:hypothetical protein